MELPVVEFSSASKESRLQISPTITLLSDLDFKNTDITLKVRVIRMWKKHFSGFRGNSFIVEMILLDEQGNKIQAFVRDKCYPKFERLLKEKQCLIIRQAIIDNNNPKFRYIDSPFKICFEWKTTMVKCDNFHGCPYGFNFVDFKDIIEKTVSQTSVIDVIGNIFQCQQMQSFTSTKQKLTKKLSMQLQNLSGLLINVTLWDAYAQQMNDFLEANKPIAQLLLSFSLGNLEVTMVSIQFQTLLMSLDCSSTPKLMKSYNLERVLLKVKYTNKATSSGALSREVFYSLYNDFLFTTKFYTMNHLYKIETVSQAVIVGTITTIKDNVIWFKIPITVEDCTCKTELTLFDKEARKILKVDAKVVVDNYLEGRYNGYYHEEFELLLLKTFAFKIQYAQFNKDTHSNVYGISLMTDDAEIISELQKRFDPEQAAVNSSMSDNNGNFPVHSTNITPLTNDLKSTGKTNFRTSNYSENHESIKGKGVVNGEKYTSHEDIPVSIPNPCQKEVGVKRNLEKVFDVDDYVCQSSSKQSTKSHGNVKDLTEVVLLVPKREK